MGYESVASYGVQETEFLFGCKEEGVNLQSSTLFRLNTLEQSILHIIKYRVVLNDRQILCLRFELLVGIDTRSEHLGTGLGTHGAHLLCHLVRGCSQVSDRLMLL